MGETVYMPNYEGKMNNSSWSDEYWQGKPDYSEDLPPPITFSTMNLTLDDLETVNGKR
jgi:hypothetical protein